MSTENEIVDFGEGSSNSENFTKQKETKLSKFDILFFNNGWNDKNETLIVSIGENAASYKLMHEIAASRYSLLNRIIGLIFVILNAILSAQTVFLGRYSECDSTLSQKIIIYTVTIIAIVNNFLDFQTNATLHQNAIKMFSELYHDIQQQMCLYRKDRFSAVKYIQNTMRQYDTLVDTSPNIPLVVLLEFKLKYKNSDISIPDIADRIQKIDIITERKPGNKLHTMVDFSKNLGNCLEIDGDISENDRIELENYLKNESKNAHVKYEFDRLKMQSSL